MSHGVGRRVRALIALLGAAVGVRGQTTQEQSRQMLETWRKSMAAKWMDDFGDLERYREANSKLPLPAQGERRVVFLGDSITEAWKLEEFFPGKGYINRGIGGQTTPQMLIRFRTDV